MQVQLSKATEASRRDDQCDIVSTVSVWCVSGELKLCAWTSLQRRNNFAPQIFGLTKYIVNPGVVLHTIQGEGRSQGGSEPYVSVHIPGAAQDSVPPCVGCLSLNMLRQPCQQLPFAQKSGRWLCLSMREAGVKATGMPGTLYATCPIFPARKPFPA